MEPAGGQKAAGFAVSTRPPARWVNWLLNNLYTWMQYLNAPVGTGAGEGIAAEGGSTSGSGLKGTGGAPNGKGVEGVGTGSGAGVYAKGSVAGTGYALRAIAGHADGPGIEVESGADATACIYAHGGGSDALIYALAAAGTGPAVYASHTAGRGLVVSGDTTSPLNAPLRIIPQNALPTEAEIGDLSVVGGKLYICTTAGVFGGTLVWTVVGTQT